jgi:hypothetical protein
MLEDLSTAEAVSSDKKLPLIIQGSFFIGRVKSVAAIFSPSGYF